MDFVGWIFWKLRRKEEGNVKWRPSYVENRNGEAWNKGWEYKWRVEIELITSWQGMHGFNNIGV